MTRIALVVCDLTTNCGPANVCKSIKKNSLNLDFWDTKQRTLKSFIRGIVCVLFS